MQKAGNGWLNAATVLTAGYLLFLFVYLVPNTAACAEGTFWTRFLSCRSINEVGDFLAGAFAPIAFLWLVAAVLIQAQELRAQREELALTRQELADSRAVMKEHAEQARNQAIQAQRQADFIGEQTENFKRQAEESYRERQDNVFAEMIRSIHHYLNEYFDQTHYKISTNKGTIILSFPNIKSIGTDATFLEINRVFSRIEEALSNILPSEQWPIRDDEINSLIKSLDELIIIADRLSPAGRIKYNSLKIKDTRGVLSKILSLKDKWDAAR